jgi:zinc transport system substrate-binding protein
MIKKSLYLFLTIFWTALSASSPHIVVSIAPHRELVQQICGSDIKVDVLVPSGASSHNYEPSYAQLEDLANANIWFRIGEEFEHQLINGLKDFNPQLTVVDLRESVDLIDSEGCLEHCHHSKDPHIWLSLKEMKNQAALVYAALTGYNPKYEILLKNSFLKLIHRLDQADKELADELNNTSTRVLVSSHASFAYFCRDYSFSQIAIEEEGKESSIKNLNKAMEAIKASGAKNIFTQKQFNNRGAYFIAEHLGLKIKEFDPYAKDYISNIKRLAEMLKE